MKTARVWPVPAILLTVLLAACNGDIDGVKTYDYKGNDHRQGRIDYKENPPVGGAHNPTWQNCGVYDDPINSEHAVHSLEHGAVWITYRPDLSSEQVDQLKKLVDGHNYALLSPFPEQSSPVMATAWNRQLAVESADDARLEKFLDKFENGAQAPERGALCTNGVSTTR